MAILGQERDAEPHRLAGRANADRLAADPDLAARGPGDAEDHLRDLRPAGADEPEEAQDLAGAKVEAHVLDETGAGETADAENRRADLGLLLGEEGAGLRADHGAHGRLGRELGGGAGGDAAAGAQDGDVVAEPEDLVDEVADEQNCDALRLQMPHDLEKPVHLAARYGRGRLVHDQHARVDRQRLDDLDRLPLGDAEHPHRHVRIDVHPQACQQIGGRGGHRGPVDASHAPRLPADEDVLRNGEIGKEGGMLVDDGDALALRVDRPEDRRLGPVPQDLAGIGLIDAAEDLDERALARAVLAGERMHAPALKGETDIAQDLDGPEAFRNAAKLDQGNHASPPRIRIVQVPPPL